MHLLESLVDLVVEVQTLMHLVVQPINLHKTVVSQILHNLVSLVVKVELITPIQEVAVVAVVLAVLVELLLRLVMVTVVLVVLVEQTPCQVLL